MKVASNEVRLMPDQNKQSMNLLNELHKIEKAETKIAMHEASAMLVSKIKEDHSENSTKKRHEEDHSKVTEDGNKTLAAPAPPEPPAPPAKRFKDSDSASEVPRDKSLEQLTPLQYRAEEKALREELDDVYSAYIDVPEMHPNYSEKYNDFLKTKGATGLVSEAEWAEYWHLELDKFKNIELAEKKKPIIAKYKQMLAVKTSARSNAGLEPAYTKVDSVIVPYTASHSHAQAESDQLASDCKASTAYSALDSFGVLEGLTGHIGLLGAALKGLIDLARNAGSTTKKALKILLQEDNVTLMNMCISRLRRELDHATPRFSHQLNQGVVHAEKLLKFAAEEIRKEEKFVPNNGDFGLALQAIAKATEGQSSSYIVNFIKCSLDLQGAVYNKKDLNELFLAVSAIHFDMSVNLDPQSANCVAPESKSSRVLGSYNTNPIPTEDVPSSIQQTKNINDSQFTSIHQNQDSNKHVQHIQNSQISSGKRFHLNMHSHLGTGHEPHSDDPYMKYPDELKSTKQNQSSELQEGSKSMQHHTERLSESNMSKMSDTSGKIDLEKLLNSGTSKDMLKNILRKIPSKSNSQQLTQEPCSSKYNPATKSQMLSYQALHQISDILSQSSTATAKPCFGEAKSYSSYPEAADTTMFDARDDVSLHHVATEGSSGHFNSRENVTAQSQICNTRDLSYYADSHDHSAVPSDDYQLKYFPGKRVSCDELNFSTSSSSSSQRQFFSQAVTYPPYSDDCSQHLSYQSSTRLQSSATSSQQNPAYHSGMQSARHETSSQQHLAYPSGTQSTKHETSSPQYPTYRSGRQLTKLETSSQQHSAYPSPMQSTIRETSSQQHLAYPTGMQSTRDETSSQQHPALPSRTQTTRHETSSAQYPTFRSDRQSTKPETNAQLQAIYHSGMQSTGQETNTQQQGTYYSSTQTESYASGTQQYPAYPPGLQSTSLNENYSTAASLEDDTRSNSSSWFINKVKNIVNLPNLSLSKFNKELSTILKDKPTDYKFSKSDLLIVKELQTLGSLNVSEALFISTLKGKFLGL